MRYFFLLTFLLASSFIHSQDISEGLIGHYPFNGNADDHSEFDNHGENFGAVLTEDRFGNANSAYLFNGTDSYITISSSSSLESPDTALTMSAWIYPVGFSLVGDAFGPILMKSDNPGNSFMYRLDIYQEGVGVALNNWNNSEVLETDIPMNEWHHIAVTFCSSMVKFYVNNVLLSEVPFTTNMVLNDLPLEIGRDVPGLLEVFNGAIDDIRIYNRCLSQEEINEIYLETPLSIASFQNSIFSVSPNPSNGKITVRTNQQTHFDYIQLFDELGRQVRDQRFPATSIQTLDFTGLKSGIYLMVIFDGKSKSSVPIIIN